MPKKRTDPTPETSPAPGMRRFRMLDGMILIVALAGGFEVTRTVFPRDVISWSSIREMAWNDGDPVAAAPGMSLLIAPSLAALSVALVPIRLIRPRPRRWASRPGMMASLAVSAVVAGVTLWALLAIPLLHRDREAFRDFLTEIIEAEFIFPTLFSVAIASGWTSLAICRRWRPEPGWIDRTGRALSSWT